MAKELIKYFTVRVLNIVKFSVVTATSCSNKKHASAFTFHRINLLSISASPSLIHYFLKL